MYMVGCNESGMKSGKEVYYDYTVANETSWLIADHESARVNRAVCIFSVLEEIIARRLFIMIL